MTRRGIVAALCGVVRAFAGQEPGKNWATYGVVVTNKPTRITLSLDSTSELEVRFGNKSVSITPKEIMDALEDKPHTGEILEFPAVPGAVRYKIFRTEEKP